MNTGLFDLRRAARAGLALVAALALGGCASQQAMDQLKDTNNTLTERNAELGRRVQELETENGLLQRQRTASETTIADLTRLNDALKQQMVAAGMDLDSLNKRLAGLQLSPVDPETDRALTALAA